MLSSPAVGECDTSVFGFEDELPRAPPSAAASAAPHSAEDVRHLVACLF